MDNSMEMISSMVVYRCHMKICGLQMEAFLDERNAENCIGIHVKFS